MEQKVKPEVLIEQWSLCGGQHRKCPQGRPYGHLTGTIYRHHNQRDVPHGERACTTAIQQIDDAVAETLNTLYALGVPAGI
jgi:hypothetical protein